MTDLLALAAELVDIPSVSHHESALADRVETDLRGASAPRRLTLRRHRGGPDRARSGPACRARRPSRHRAPLRRRGAHVSRATRCRDLGAVDMKGGLAVMLDLAATLPAPAVDVTYVFYPCEEVAHQRQRPRPASPPRGPIFSPPTPPCSASPRRRRRGGMPGHAAGGGDLSGVGVPIRPGPGCGVNAVHRLAAGPRRLGRYQPRGVVLDGCEYTEQLQAVGIEGGVASNVVPDEASVKINFRFAPDRRRRPLPSTRSGTAGRGARPRGRGPARGPRRRLGGPSGLGPPRAGVTRAGHREPRPGQGGLDRRGHVGGDRGARRQLRSR